MSNAYQCDRCGELYAGKPSHRLEEWHENSTFYSMFENGRAELCGTCNSDLGEFMIMQYANGDE